MRSTIFTSIANVIRFSAEGTEMLCLSLSLRLQHLKSCAGLSGKRSSVSRLLRQLLAVEPGVNPAWAMNASFAFAPQLIPVTATSGSRFSYRDGRGIDASDHQRLMHNRSLRSS